MSYPTRTTSKSLVTVWPSVTHDKFGRKTYGDAFTIKCTVDQSYSKTMVDNKGAEFVPELVIYAEYFGFDKPLEGDMIAVGDHASSATPVDGSIPVKTSAIEDCSLIGERDDIRIACGR
jgi:hypothetical protein